MRVSLIAIACLFLIGCQGWSDDDKTYFSEKCKKEKFKKSFCDCALEKAMAEFETFDAATSADSVILDKAFLPCLDKDREEESKE